MSSIQITSTTVSDISNLEYMDRQLVVISNVKTIEDIILDYATALLQTPINLIKETGNQRVIDQINKIEESLITVNTIKVLRSLRSHYKTLSPSKLSSEIFARLLMQIIKLNKKSSILTISQSQAATLSFPPGHAMQNLVYAGHPADSRMYYPIADFHRRVFEHKFSEAVRLLMSLGATKIKVQRVSGWGQSFSSKLSTPLSQSIIQADLSGDHTAKKESSILFEASFPGHNKPNIPDNLVWYDHEPSWINIADARMRYGLEDFSLSVHYTDDLGINMSLGIGIESAKFNLGGKFEGHESTIWKLEGKFLPGAVSML